MISPIKDQFLWCESYRPQTIEECVLPESLKKTFSDYVAQGQLPHFLFSGTAGVGKTTVAKALCNEIGAEYILINGSDEGRNIDTLRTTIKGFATSVSLTDARKVVIIDEADYMNCFAGSQTLLVEENGRILEKPIESLVGMKDLQVLTYNFPSGRVEVSTAYAIEMGEREVFEVEFDDGTVILCTKDHPFFSADGGSACIESENLFCINRVDIDNLIDTPGIQSNASLYISGIQSKNQ